MITFGTFSLFLMNLLAAAAAMLHVPRSISWELENGTNDLTLAN